MFDLNELKVGKGAVIRRHARLLSGASMEPYSIMLENTLVVSGDVLDAGSVWQGWPARMVSALGSSGGSPYSEKKKKFTPTLFSTPESVDVLALDSTMEVSS